VNTKLEKFYNENQDELHRDWDDYISYKEMGSGEDKIEVTDDMFWEFVEERMEEQEMEEKNVIKNVLDRLPNWYKKWGYVIDIAMVAGFLIFFLI
jgi:hypothetical protein